MSIVYTGGTFDLPHEGHVRLFNACKKIAGPNGDVIVSLNTDEFVKEFKGQAPIMTYAERKAVIEEFASVDMVIENIGGADSKRAITCVKPDFIVVGSDWAKKDYYKQMQFTQEWLDEMGITLCYVPYTDRISTTILKERLSKCQ
jgi:cytidyltransferase-like protein